MATPDGEFPTGIGEPTTVLLAVAITKTRAGAGIRHNDVLAVRGNGYPGWGIPHRDRGADHGVAGRGDHQDGVVARNRHIGVFPIRGDRDLCGTNAELARVSQLCKTGSEIRKLISRYLV
jgi:hypothetical protein